MGPRVITSYMLPLLQMTWRSASVKWIRLCSCALTDQHSESETRPSCPPPDDPCRPGSGSPSSSELVDAIVRGAIPPGSTLPPEAALCEQFGVSRTVIRESVKQLEEKGLVVVAQGRGTLVLPTASWNMIDETVLSALIANDETLGVLDDLSHVRATLEGLIARDAARSGDTELIGRLRDALELMRDTMAMSRRSTTPTSSSTPSSARCRQPPGRRHRQDALPPGSRERALRQAQRARHHAPRARAGLRGDRVRRCGGGGGRDAFTHHRCVGAATPADPAATPQLAAGRVASAAEALVELADDIPRALFRIAEHDDVDALIQVVAQDAAGAGTDAVLEVGANAAVVVHVEFEAETV